MTIEAVYNFLKAQNRPHSAGDVGQSLKDLGKSAIQKALDSLVAKKKVVEKVYGKQKIYCISQDEVVVKDDEVANIEKSINEKSESLTHLERELKSKQNEMKLLRESMTQAEAEVEYEKLCKEVANLEEKYKMILEEKEAAGKRSYTDEEKLKIESDHTKYMKEYKKRRKLCNDMVDTILEGFPKSKKEFIEEVGIETDEEAGCTLGK